MDKVVWVLIILVLEPLYGHAWRASPDERRQVRELRREKVHYHSKRHMLTNDSDVRRRTHAPRTKENRKKLTQKPAGNLTPLKEDDIDNDEVVSVAIGPPSMRPMFDKPNWKHPAKTTAATPSTTRGGSNCTHGATNMVKDIFTEIGREFMTHQVSEDFVFGQYVGNAMRNISTDLKLKMQHEILELVIKYQKLSKGEITTPKPEEKNPLVYFSTTKRSTNDTEDPWPDFNNLANIVG